MKIQKTLKPITLALMVIGIAASSFANSTANNKLTFCYTYSTDAIPVMVLNPTPLNPGEKCPGNGGWINASSVQDAKDQIYKSNRGNAITDCNNFFQQCKKTLEVHANTTPDFNNNLCTAQQNVCMAPVYKADLNKLLQTLNPEVAHMLQNMKPE
jgi:hypothetical protein